MYTIINKISSQNVPKWGNQKEYIAVHYLGVDGQNNKIEKGGYGAHFYIYWDGTIYQAAGLDAILWQVGAGSSYKQKHPTARNSNTIGIEMCCHCDGNPTKAGTDWWFTKETQEACVWLVQKLMNELNIPIENVLRHHDIVNKTCPAPYVHNNGYRGSWTWDEFLAKVKGSVQPVPETEKLYRIRTSWIRPETQIGAYKKLSNAKAACKPGYTVYDWNGNVVYTLEEYPWVGECTGNGVNVRRGPGVGYMNIEGWPKLNKGNLFDVLGKEGAWYRILIDKKHEGYIAQQYVRRV